MYARAARSTMSFSSIVLMRLKNACCISLNEGIFLSHSFLLGGVASQDNTSAFWHILPMTASEKLAIHKVLLRFPFLSSPKSVQKSVCFAYEDKPLYSTFIMYVPRLCEGLSCGHISRVRSGIRCLSYILYHKSRIFQ